MNCFFKYCIPVFCLQLGACQLSNPGNEQQSISQNPSPMVDHIRPHHRIRLDSVKVAGQLLTLDETVQGRLYWPDLWKGRSTADLIIHFHGDYRVAQHSIDQQQEASVLFHCSWGSGSSAYSRPIEGFGGTAFLEEVKQAVYQKAPDLQIDRIFLSGWSAGYGAIRSLIQNEELIPEIDGILLLDGMHCSYSPENRVMAKGGVLNKEQMQAFVHWAGLAVQGQKSMLITHSAIFPGTYASTTETADYILQSLSLPRRPLLKNGPMGMQQTSVAGQEKLLILSFAGNSAPDHIDHYHGLATFLSQLRSL